ncbi:MAG: hypothetical protein ABIP51_06855 [Bacteroidia bacterium]
MKAILGMVETIFRFPANKPPYIGVVVSGTAGVMLNANWVKDHSEEEWQIKANLEMQCFSITLYCTRLNLKYVYSTPSVNQQELAKFIEAIKRVEYFNFGHVNKSNGEYKPELTNYFKPWVLKCSSFEFTWEY